MKNKNEIECQQCHKPFVPRAKFCSAKCRMDDFIVRRAEKILKGADDIMQEATPHLDAKGRAHAKATQNITKKIKKLIASKQARV